MMNKTPLPRWMVDSLVRWKDSTRLILIYVIVKVNTMHALIHYNNIQLMIIIDHPVKLFFRAQPLLDYCNGQKEQHLLQHVLWSGQLQCILPEVIS
jgi:hypothetical protein